ncbi:uncharacterized protein LOC123559398 [Mercenaria mercenaria]|uniref:uncharacterized protein LOC123559398 n=1 Tax=Mercenaria mercenaria TaxID=6596 RepID=UPI001E1D62A4|nr:uncharacterized protein LOC123559398 [Mercenaria mercenaria]
MSLSKLTEVTKNDALDIKVHYSYHGQQRCGLIDTTFNNLYSMDYFSFINHLKCEIPQLNKLEVLRVCFMDEEKTYIDLTAKNFHRFLRLATLCFQSDIPKINLKVLEGSSPMPKPDSENKKSETSKPKRLFDSEEYVKTPYRSPIELELSLKRQLLSQKEKEFMLAQSKYDAVSNEYVVKGYQDTSKTVCTRCHLRLGHTRNRCHMDECTTARNCGNIDRHAAEKRELTELGKQKQKLEGELNALKSELQIKEALNNDVMTSFEAKIHDILIRTNPEKYLSENRRPKEGVILADSYILKKFYGNSAVDKATMERDCDIFQTIIQSHEEKMNVKRPKNSVVNELERREISWPGSTNVNEQSMQTLHQGYYYGPSYPMAPWFAAFQSGCTAMTSPMHPSVSASIAPPVASPPLPVGSPPPPVGSTPVSFYGVRVNIIFKL